MSQLKAFLKKNIKQPQEIEYIASERITEEIDGEIKPIKWIMKPISTQKNEEIIEACKNHKGELDMQLYSRYLATYCTIFPPIFSEELQKDWGISNPVELLKEILCIPSEYNNYCLKAQEICGFKTNKEKIELVDKAKN